MNEDIYGSIFNIKQMPFGYSYFCWKLRIPYQAYLLSDGALWWSYTALWWSATKDRTRGTSF
jgi:hypothetical protein